MVYYLLNDNLLRVDGLTDIISGAYVNDATVTVTEIRDSSGTLVTGQSFPITLAYVAASNGRYQGLLEDSLSLTAHGKYTARINIVGIDGKRGHFKRAIRAMERTD